MRRLMKSAAIVVIGLLASGCEVYLTSEGVGYLDVSSGFFQCYNEAQCEGVIG